MLKDLMMGVAKATYEHCGNIKCNRLRTLMKQHIIGCITLRGQHGVSMLSHMALSSSIRLARIQTLANDRPQTKLGPDRR